MTEILRGCGGNYRDKYCVNCGECFSDEVDVISPYINHADVVELYRRHRGEKWCLEVLRRHADAEPLEDDEQIFADIYYDKKETFDSVLSVSEFNHMLKM